MCDYMQWGGTFYVYAGFSLFVRPPPLSLHQHQHPSLAPRSSIPFIVHRMPCLSLSAWLTWVWGVAPPVMVGQALVFYALLVPETTGMPLEAISPLFDQPRKLVKTNLDSLRARLRKA